MPDNSRAFAHILGNVLIWSLFPLLSVRSLQTDPLAALFYAQVGGFLFCLPFSRKKPLKDIWSDVTAAPGLLLLLSLASLFLGIFFVFSLDSLNSFTATITLELWPIFGLVFSALFIKKSWQDLSAFTFSLFAVASVGVALMAIVSAESSGEATKFGGIGLTLAILAAVASGATLVQTRLYFLFEKVPSFAGASYTIILLRLVSIPVIFAIALLQGADLFSPSALWIGLLLGVTCYGLASVMTISGLRYSTRTSHILLWYLTPAIASIWLVSFSDESLSDLHILAFMPILLANIFSNFTTIRRTSFFLMSGFSLTIGISIYVLPGTDGQYFFNAVGLAMGAFAIIVAFVLQRKLNDIREIGMQLAEGLSASKGTAVEGDAYIDAVEMQLFNPDTETTELNQGRTSDVLFHTVNHIKVERATSFSSAETLVLGLLTFTIVVFSLFFRGEGLIFDLLAFSVCFAAVFLTVFVVEASSFKFQWRVVKNALLTDGRAVVADRDTVLLSILGTIAMICFILLLFMDKWVLELFSNDFKIWFSTSFLGGR